MARRNFLSLFNNKKPVLGMIHIQALPGTPNNYLQPEKIIRTAIKEAQIYKDAGIDGIIIENMHDVPYLKREVGHEISTLISIIAYEIKRETKLPIGIQILAGANKAALAAAFNSGADFIRAEGFVFAHTADEGYIESDAGELLRYRKSIGAENIFVLTDIKKKHSSHTLTQDISIAGTAKAAEYFLSDGLIVTGTSTGEEPLPDELEKVSSVSNLPIIIGSGMTAQNISSFYNFADVFIVGSYFKKSGIWTNAPDKKRISLFLKNINKNI